MNQEIIYIKLHFKEYLQNQVYAIKLFCSWIIRTRFWSLFHTTATAYKLQEVWPILTSPQHGHRKIKTKNKDKQYSTQTVFHDMLNLVMLPLRQWEWNSANNPDFMPHSHFLREKKKERKKKKWQSSATVIFLIWQGEN